MIGVSSPLRPFCERCGNECSGELCGGCREADATGHDALIADISAQLASISVALADTSSLHFSDQHTAIEALRKLLDAQAERLEAAQDTAWALAAGMAAE